MKTEGIVDLTAKQIELLGCLQTAVESKPNRRIIHCHECLGYLPYVFYHWIEVDRQDISNTLPIDWSCTDVEALLNAGHLAKMDERKSPDDDCETKVTYEVTSA